jgi:hypothetical protein
MPFTDRKLHFRTIKCDGPGCDKEVEIELGDVEGIQKIDWLLTVRVVQCGDNRALAYCSDVCEVKGITAGQHNVKEKSKIVPATEGDVKGAAAQASAETQITEDLKTGAITLD